MKKSTQKSNPCCPLLAKIIHEKKLSLVYSPPMREYNIHLRNDNAVQGIFFCPWCGTKLPCSLREEYFDLLHNYYNLDVPIMGNFDQPELPDELRSDIWWKKRDL